MARWTEDVEAPVVRDEREARSAADRLVRRLCVPATDHPAAIARARALGIELRELRDRLARRGVPAGEALAELEAYREAALGERLELDADEVV